MDDEEHELLDFLLAESGRPVTFLAMFDRDDIPEAVRTTRCARRADDRAAARAPQTSPLPLTREINMRNPFSFAAFPSWKRVFEDKSKEAQRAVYRDPAFRNHFREELKNADRRSAATGAASPCTRCTSPALKRSRAAPSPTSPRSAARTASTPSST